MTMKTPPDRYAFAETSCRAQSVADRRQAIQTPFSKTLCLLNGEKRSAGRQRRIRCLHGRDKEEGQELKEALDTVDLAVIPLGATEQHGPHGTFAVDTGRAEGFARRLGERLYPRAVICPVIPYGFSPHHMSFPGTITLTGSTYLKILEEIVDSLYRHGLRKFFFANSHGGNRPPLEILMGELTARYSDVKAAHCVISRMAREVYAAETHSAIMGHACEGEMSQAMVLAPYTVRTEALERADLKYTEEQWERRKVLSGRRNLGRNFRLRRHRRRHSGQSRTRRKDRHGRPR